jgi:hypothetical protein
MSLQLSDYSNTSQSHSVVTFPCHVERLYGEIYRSVRLRCSLLNGVEASVTVSRCFDSVYCKLTTLIVNFKRSALVAQHDKRERYWSSLAGFLTRRSTHA